MTGKLHHLLKKQKLLFLGKEIFKEEAVNG